MRKAEATWRSTDDVSLPPVQEINLFHQPEEASTKDFVFSKLPLFLADNGCLMFLFALVLNWYYPSVVELNGFSNFFNVLRQWSGCVKS